MNWLSLNKIITRVLKIVITASCGLKAFSPFNLTIYIFIYTFICKCIIEGPWLKCNLTFMQFGMTPTLTVAMTKLIKSLRWRKMVVLELRHFHINILIVWFLDNVRYLSVRISHVTLCLAMFDAISSILFIIFRVISY